MSFGTGVHTLLAIVGALAILVGIVAAAFFFGGFYSVAADNSDPNFVSWALIHVRRASIDRHATGQPPLLEDTTMVRAGVRAYSEIGCVNCHGGPGVEPDKFSEGLNPPPNLKEVINDLQPQEVFWVIKHGIKMTGMPSFGARNPPVPDQTIWSIVAGASLSTYRWSENPGVGHRDFFICLSLPVGSLRLTTSLRACRAWGLS